MPVTLTEKVMLSDPAAICRTALLGLGVTFTAVPDVLPHLESGALIHLIPHRDADAGQISLYYTGRTLLPAKTCVFVDFVSESLRRTSLAERLAGSLG